MRLLVAIPTYKNFSSGYTIAKTLNGLVQQNIKDFRLLIVYKTYPLDKTLDIIDNYKDRLEIEITKQKDGYVEEAMNLIFNISRDYDIVLTLDDDTIPCNTWIDEHIYLHKCFNRVGLITGLLEPFVNVHRKNQIIEKIYNIWGYYKPLYSEFKYYLTYINDMGLSVDFNPLIVRPYDRHIDNLREILEQSIFTLSAGAIGANMSFKGKTVENFTLPGATLRGIGYEQVFVTHLIRQGFQSAIANCCRVKHLERKSLSRMEDIYGDFAIGLETYVQPYSINIYEKINTKKLKLFNQILRLYAKWRHTIYSEAVFKGLTIAIKAIEEEWKPNTVRDAIYQVFGEFKTLNTIVNRESKE